MENILSLKRVFVLLAGLFLAVLFSSSLFAAPLTVRVQPSGDSFAKAYVITGEARTYFGNVEGGTGPYQYRWEFSNGVDSDYNTVGNARYIGYDGIVFDSAGTQWARLTVQDSTSPTPLTASATVNLQVIAAADDNLNRQKNSAIDRGLRYLYRQEQVVSSDSSYWPGSGSPFGSTGMALLAMENHGHNLQSPDTDIYKKSVRGGVNYLLENAQTQAIGTQSCIGDPEANDGDSDNDGLGVKWNDSMYENPIAMLGLINSCDKATAQAYVAPSGALAGQTMWDIMVDAKDFLAWAQNDSNGIIYMTQTSENDSYGYLYFAGDTVSNVHGYLHLQNFATLGMGGDFTINWGDGTSTVYTDKEYFNYGSEGYPELNWNNTDTLDHIYTSAGDYLVSVSYTSNGNTVPVMEATLAVGAGSSCSLNDVSQYGAGGWRYNPNYGSSDNSVTQWPVLALSEAEARWDIKVNPQVVTMLDYWLQYSQDSTSGAFGYTAPTDWVNFPKTAAGTIMLHYVGLPESDSRMTATYQYLDNNWTSENYYDSGSYMYSMYAFYKGMKIWNRADFFGRTWEELYTDNLIHTQLSDGNWNDAYGWEDTLFATYSALAILAPEVASLPPVANAGGPYADVNPGQTVTLNGSASYHQDPARSLVKWEWDFDAGNGLWWDTKAAPAAGEGAVGLIVTATYPDTGADANYTVTLRVTDNTSPTPMTDTDTAAIHVTTGNVPPVAVTNGPWTGLPNQAIVFDGSASYDPNAGDPALNDSIVSYEWDLDGDGSYNEANGDDGTPVTSGDYRKVTKTFPAPISLPAKLRVTDTYGLVGTSEASTNIVAITIVYANDYYTCYRQKLDRYRERQGLQVTFRNDGTAQAENLNMILTSLPSNMTINDNHSSTSLGALAAGQQKASACNPTAMTADIEIITDRRISPTGTWKWRSEFDFNGSHYVVDNIPAVGP